MKTPGSVALWNYHRAQLYSWALFVIVVGGDRLQLVVIEAERVVTVEAEIV